MTLVEYPRLEQGTSKWHEARRGIVTASVVGRLIILGPPDATTVACPACKVEVGACISLSRKVPTALKKVHDERAAAAGELPSIPRVADNETSSTLTASLVAERITGISETLPPNRDMNRGIWSEPYARDLYAAHYGKVAEVGFMRYDGDGWTLGYSPDGLVGDDGLIEIKAPRSKTQVLTVLTDDVPAHYMAQCQAGLLASGRKWLDFVSYAGGMHVYVKRVLPDPAWFAAIEAACRTFETTAAAMVADYHERVAGRPVAPLIDFELEVI
ncbi:lambda exonuclease family protein [Nocardioides aurantiacus]|uniref:YqaJ-like recombinase protein n=1 Tax=Nocardioides aurantiacus TaxID=86796 RepID=A0A3N2CWD8_9ACTN|nr:lambda exonuclease family protein [Nocardioides aurantiacus]ROR91728.1 YqaJ-like recombinase protein [Nocardioides aurantiacus]